VDREGRRPLLADALPHDFPPWEAVYHQTQRWLAAGIFETMAHDLRGLLRLASDREPEPTSRSPRAGAHEPEPTAAILESRTLRSTPESGARGGYDGAKRK
jgi:transposase